MIASAANTRRDSLACLIIDDPLIRPRYGCLDYERLLDKMKLHGFFTEIAFIPWNYSRSSAETVRLVAENNDYFRLCVHGCNHTWNEFASQDYRHLCALSSTALWRMEEHKRLTGLSYDPVMVFPQGRFSSLAVKALKAHGYRAVFNSTIRATDVTDLPPTEYQGPCTIAYDGLPLFRRRYMREKSELVRDLDSGRPLVIVAHHKDLRERYRPLTEFIDWINGLGKIEWRSLAEIADYYSEPTGVPLRAENEQPTWNAGAVALRRFASEFRDNVVERNRLLCKLYKTVRGR